jgi:nitroimidazol reductase NimA-like FMN-containing flavoprotein (pyridoxamine 5'-phosphate oxidase superfamily)
VKEGVPDMRNMSPDEIIDFIKYYTWGTLIGVEPDGRPYAVELSYGFDGTYIYCGSRPGGRMARCLKQNQQVAFKICESDRSYSSYTAVIIEATAERLTSRADILASVRSIARQRGLNEKAFDGVVDHVAGNPGSNSLRIPVTNISGVTTR